MVDPCKTRNFYRGVTTMKIQARLTQIVIAAGLSHALQTRRSPGLLPWPHQLLLSAITLVCLIPAGYVHAAVVNYSYDALGRVTKAVYGGDMSATITYDYDETGNWTLVTTTRATP